MTKLLSVLALSLFVVASAKKLVQTELSRALSLEASNSVEFHTKYSIQPMNKIVNTATGSIYITNCGNNFQIGFLFGVCRAYYSITSGKVVGSVIKSAVSTESKKGVSYTVTSYKNQFCNGTVVSEETVGPIPSTCTCNNLDCFKASASTSNVIKQPHHGAIVT